MSDASLNPLPDSAPDLGEIRTQVADAVSNRLAALLEEARSTWAPLGDAGAELWGAAQVLLGSGKRMRPLAAALGWGLMADGVTRHALASSPAMAHLGAALELYQASALVHDDVIDAAPTRRGEPAAHRRLAALHREGAWLGDAEAFGERGAILLGDWLLSASGQELGRAVASVPTTQDAAAARVREAFDAMTAEVALGQYLDLRSEVLPLPATSDDPWAAGEAMKAQALTVIRHKSARYSVRHPLTLGALAAGLEPGSPAMEALSAFGEEVGIAFQLRDDALGVFGQESQTGKPVGDDVREGKRTVLLALTWQRCDADGRALLARVYGGEAGPDSIAQVVGLMDASGARAAHEELIAAHRQAGLAALATLSREIPAQSAQYLAAFANLLTDRLS